MKGMKEYDDLPTKWSMIRAKYEHVFNGRTNVDLKDKWRNLNK